MFVKIEKDTQMTEGAGIRELHENGNYEYFTLGKFIPRNNGYEIKIPGIKSGIKSGIIFYRTKSALIAKNCEIEIE